MTLAQYLILPCIWSYCQKSCIGLILPSLSWSNLIVIRGKSRNGNQKPQTGRDRYEITPGWGATRLSPSLQSLCLFLSARHIPLYVSEVSPLWPRGPRCRRWVLRSCPPVHRRKVLSASISILQRPCQQFDHPKIFLAPGVFEGGLCWGLFRRTSLQLAWA